MNLAAESGQWSRQLLQNLVDILTTMVDGLVDSFKGEAQDMFKDKYADVVSNLLLEFYNLLRCFINYKIQYIQKDLILTCELT